MICDFCQGQTVSRRVKKHRWHNGRLFVLENVPAEVCQECGTRYYHASTLDDIDSWLDRDHPVKRKLEVEAVSLPGS